MSTTCKKGSLKHKLDNALASTNAAKKRCSSPKTDKSLINDSGLGSSVSAKKKPNVIKTGNGRVGTKRRLETNVNNDKPLPVKMSKMESDKTVPCSFLSRVRQCKEEAPSTSTELIPRPLKPKCPKATKAAVNKKSAKTSTKETPSTSNEPKSTKVSRAATSKKPAKKKAPSASNEPIPEAESPTFKAAANKNTSTPVSKIKQRPKTPVSTKKKQPVKKIAKAKRKLVVDETPMEVSEMNVSQILALGEGTSLQTEATFEDSDSEESDWEEVAETPVLTEPVIPENGVDITLDHPVISFKRKKREHDFEGEVRRQLKRRQKEIQELMHKVHLLCWIAHLKAVNSILNSEVLLADAHSLLKSNKLYPPKHTDLTYLERIVKVFRKYISLDEDKKNADKDSLEVRLSAEFKAKTAFSKDHLVFMLVVFLRALGVKVRIVMSLVTVPLKPTPDKPETAAKGTKKTVKEEPEDKPSTSQKGSLKSNLAKNLKKEEEESPSTSQKGSLKSNLEKNLKKDAKGTVKRNSKDSKKPAKKGKASVEKVDSDDEISTKPAPKGKQKPGKTTVKEEDNSDDDFSPKQVRPTVTKKKLDRRVLSSDEEVSALKKKGQDVWVEVFLEEEEKWMTVDIVKQRVHCVQFLYNRATHPVVYILACNNDSTIKDVTKRYVPNWHSDTRKKRVAEAWWLESLEPYKPADSAVEREEDEDIARQLQDMPLPTSIAEYKFHPLYALKRHLLKFEGIYPPDAPTLGFVRGEPVYGRECVVTLRSRDIWFKEARVVRLGETPYKIVKSRPKYDKMTGEFKKDLPLEVFGVWQTEDYIPPVAVDGKVPRNEYGNVDLFKPCMLPGGTVHLQIPALIRVARKLGIDCAPAVVGFEFHSGGCHPLHDGFVVCEEFKDQLLDAWNKDIDESAKRAEEKRDKRIYGNWRRLIRGLIIRENLKMKYAFGETSTEESTQSSTSTQSQNLMVQKMPKIIRENLKMKYAFGETSTEESTQSSTSTQSQK